MKLYIYPGAPSPERVVQMLRHKGVELDTEIVDLKSGEQLKSPYREINPRCTVPALVLDDGSCLTEVIAICMYLDSQYPDKPVFGTNDLERAQVVNWMHRIFTEGFMAVAEALRNSSPGMKHRALAGPDNLEQIPELAERGKQRLPYLFSNLNAALEGRKFLVGNNLSQADIDAFVTCNFAGWVKCKPSLELAHLQNWQSHIAELLS